jgi:hypothetical protein
LGPAAPITPAAGRARPTGPSVCVGTTSPSATQLYAVLIFSRQYCSIEIVDMTTTRHGSQSALYTAPNPRLVARYYVHAEDYLRGRADESPGNLNISPLQPTRSPLF